MGQTLVLLKVSPEAPGDEVEVEAALKELKTGEVKDVKKEPLAFGMFVVKVAVALPEKSEPMEELQAEVKAIPKVQSVEVEGMTLI